MMRRHTLRIIGAFLILALGAFAGVEYVHRQVQSLCHTTHEFVNDLTAASKYPPGAGAPLRTQIDRGNAVRSAVRAEADRRFQCR